AVAEIIINEGADINSYGGGNFATALQAASYNQHLEILKLLLDEQVDVNTKGSKYRTAIQA
ncbi:hypothetical protein LY78DRAFT_562951, partial [Colletotrichum sublineola]